MKAKSKTISIHRLYDPIHKPQKIHKKTTKALKTNSATLKGINQNTKFSCAAAMIRKNNLKINSSPGWCGSVD